MCEKGDEGGELAGVRAAACCAASAQCVTHGSIVHIAVPVLLSSAFLNRVNVSEELFAAGRGRGVLQICARFQDCSACCG
jgi:hypothetical protein